MYDWYGSFILKKEKWKIRSEKLRIDLDNSHYLRRLKPHDLKGLRTLYKKIYKTLKDDKHEQFIHPRKKLELYTLLKGSWEWQKEFIGLFDEKNNLVGTSFIQICIKENENVLKSEFPKSPIDLFKENKNAKIAIFGGDWIDPEKRGEGWNRKMVEKKCELAKEKWCDYAIAIIDPRNTRNISPYLKNGFTVVWFWTDPSDGGPIMYLVRDLKSHMSERIQPEVPYSKHYKPRDTAIFDILNGGYKKEAVLLKAV